MTCILAKKPGFCADVLGLTTRPNYLTYQSACRMGQRVGLAIAPPLTRRDRLAQLLVAKAIASPQPPQQPHRHHGI